MAETEFKIFHETIPREQVEHMDEFMLMVANRGIERVHGNSGLLNPTDIEVTLGAKIGSPLKLSSWHETEGQGTSGRFQVTDLPLAVTLPDCDLLLDKEVYIRANGMQRACLGALLGTYLIYSMSDIIPPTNRW